MSSLRATVEMPISSQAPGPLSASATLATTAATSSSAFIADSDSNFCCFLVIEHAVRS